MLLYLPKNGKLIKANLKRISIRKPKRSKRRLKRKPLRERLKLKNKRILSLRLKLKPEQSLKKRRDKQKLQHREQSSKLPERLPKLKS
jgi:hypothetical protein